MREKKQLKSPVSRVSFLIRLRKRLGRSGEKLVTSRSSASKRTLGAYYLVNAEGDIIQTHVDVEALSRERGSLKPWEEIENA